MAKHDEEKDAGLSNAFKKLKVETDIRDQPWACLPASDKPIGDAADKDDKPRLKSPPKCFTHNRPLPYTKDKLATGLPDLTRFENLSFAKESCSNVSCKCNYQVDAGSSKCSEDSFTKAKHHLNFAQACSDDATTASPKRVLKEARLKLHHKHKDHKVVLRAARLKLANPGKDREKKKSLQKFCTPSSPPSPKLGHVKPEVIFGSTSDGGASLEDFQSFSEGKNSEVTTKACDDNNKTLPDKYDFTGAFRTRGATAETCKDKSFNLSSLLGSLDKTEEDASDAAAAASKDTSSSRPSKPPCPLHPGKCSKPCSCAHQARLDDWTEEELACYFEEFVHIPKKMSMMAEMMYT